MTRIIRRLGAPDQGYDLGYNSDGLRFGSGPLRASWHRYTSELDDNSFGLLSELRRCHTRHSGLHLVAVHSGTSLRTSRYTYGTFNGDLALTTALVVRLLLLLPQLRCGTTADSGPLRLPTGTPVGPLVATTDFAVSVP
jgi:hypothetical protein